MKRLQILPVLLALCYSCLSRLDAAKPAWISMPYLGTWETGITLATLPWDDMTHVAEAFLLPQANGAMPLFAAPGQRANLVSTAHANGTKAVISIGGASGSKPNWSSSTAPANRAAFVANIMSIVGSGGYDGVDIDWEFPAASDKANFTSLMQDLYDALHNAANANYKGTAFDGSPKCLSFYISPGYFICGVDWDGVGAYCDFAVLPGYDQCSGNFEGPIGGNYPANDCRSISYQVTVSGNMAKLTAGGANQFNFPRNKLVLGMPFYNCAGNNLETDTASGSHSSFDATAMESTWSNGAIVNDSQAFCAKMNWAFSQGFQGVSMWEMEQAYPRNGTAEVAAVWDVIGGKSGCITAAFSPTPSRTATAAFSPSPSATRTASRTASPSATRSSSPSATPSASATATLSRTPSASPTVTATASPTATPTSSPSPSPSPTLTSTASPTATRTVTVLASPSATPTASPSRTLSATGTETPLLSPTASASPTATRSSTATLTASASASASASPSPAATATSTDGPAASPTASPSATATGTPLDSPTASPPPTATASASPSVSASPTPSAGASATETPPDSPTASPQATASPSAVASGSPSPVDSATPTALPSGTSTATPTSQPSGTSTATLTPAPVASVTASPAGSASAGAGPLVIDAASLMPSVLRAGGPLPRLYFKLQGPGSAWRWSLYTRAMVLVQKATVPQALSLGWNHGALSLPEDLPPGLYYLELRVLRDGVESEPTLLKAYALR